MTESIKDKIAGTWKLISWTYNDGDGKTVDYFGDNPTGVLMYDMYGNMNAQLMKSNRANFASDSFNSGSGDETSEAFLSYLAYYGKYYETAPGEIVHQVEGSLYPNWVGMKQIRYARIEGNRLMVSTPPIPSSTGSTVYVIEWERCM